MQEPAPPLAFDEAGARRVLLVQAIEAADGARQWLPQDARDRIEQESAAATSDPGRPHEPVPAAYLAERARRILDLVGQRQPRVAGLQQPSAWTEGFALGLVLGAGLLGFALDHFLSGGRIHVLANALLGFLAWNLAVYAVLLVGAMLPRGPHGAGTRLLRWWARLPLRREGAGARWRVDAMFRPLWLQATASLQQWRLRLLMHAAAAAWALGIAASVVAGGWAKDPLVGWESLWLKKPEHAHAVLSVIYAPAAALLGYEPVSREEVLAMRYDRQAAVQGGSAQADGRAQRWVLMILALLCMVVIVPRALLAAHALWCARRAALRIELDPQQPLLAQALARVRPLRLRVGWQAADGRARQWLQRVWRQAAHDGMAQAVQGQPWPLLATARGDRLELAEQTADAATDAHLLAVSQGDAPLSDERSRGIALAGQAPCTLMDEGLRQAIVQQLPADRREACGPLLEAWRGVERSRHQDSLQLLAQALLAAAQDVEQVQPMPWWKPGDRRKAREAALAVLLQRVDERIVAAGAHCWRLHGFASPAAAALLPVHGGERPPLLGGIDAGMAGAATGMAGGAAAGALMGAKIDLLTGGLTLGAATALGGLLGAGTWIAATWDGRSEMRLSDDMLATLAELVLTVYLAVIHHERLLPPEQAGVPADWTSETIAAAAVGSTQLAALWARARKASAGTQDGLPALGEWLDFSVRAVLRRLHPAGTLAPTNKMG
jgi:hypothetical protein